ncbi:hypothetical protein M427DRAFT_264619 [Gonapodya prolifera JEL478]|uniref:SET domain-containing protein n=1 Tax=Gonapodya prolifera (strain JEL478) TaxID=1344416 RepID=A0A139AK56_GONPJ|nr:hypothetical protein M427DRAFT_264619 [Gonapodya prolifera JEL478]|eukprot:KXS17172.1 hypothetical protein M427DRAFT_264619 [Gonapodya prolifera JEL478]
MSRLFLIVPDTPIELHPGAPRHNSFLLPCFGLLCGRGRLFGLEGKGRKYEGTLARGLGSLLRFPQVSSYRTSRHRQHSRHHATNLPPRLALCQHSSLLLRPSQRHRGYYAMVSLLDALNHSSVDTVKNTWDWEQGLYRMQTLVPYDAGEDVRFDQSTMSNIVFKVFNHYKDHSNAFLLAEYGFTLPANPSDEIFADDVFWSLDVGAAVGHPTPKDREQARKSYWALKPGSDKYIF